MMTPYRYAILMFDGDDASLGQVPIDPDWEPALEWARLQALRRHGLELAGAGEPSSLAIEPLWHEAGAPYIRGFQVRTTGAETDPEPCELSLRFFHDVADAAARRLIEDGKLERGTTYRYAACAFPISPDHDADLAGSRARFAVERQPEPQRFAVEQQPDGPRFAVEQLPARPRLLQSSLSERLRGAEPIAAGGGEQEDAAELPVLLPARVLEEAADLARTEEGIETGGLLIGHLHHDPGMGELLVEVTAQLPARHTCGDATKLTFTAQTWTEARATLALRGKDEIMLGWWHSHPVRHWCRNCPLDRQRDCALARGFLSADDRALHRAIFPSAYSVALLASDVAFDEVSFSLFGWRQGRLEPRGFHRRKEGATVPGSATGSRSGERSTRESNEADTEQPAIERLTPLPAAPAPLAAVAAPLTAAPAPLPAGPAPLNAGPDSGACAERRR